MARWIYRLTPVHPHTLDAPTLEERVVLEERAEFHAALRRAGILILAGTPEDGDVWAVAIIEAPDEESARAVMTTDPAVSAGLTTATLHPYEIAGVQTGRSGAASGPGGQLQE